MPTLDELHILLSVTKKIDQPMFEKQIREVLTVSGHEQKELNEMKMIRKAKILRKLVAKH